MIITTIFLMKYNMMKIIVLLSDGLIFQTSLVFRKI